MVFDHISDFQVAWLNKIINGTVKQGAGKLYQKKKKWYFAIPITWNVESTQDEKIMGIDLGLRYLAVARSHFKTHIYTR
ncbi:hypothetical protein SAMN05444392_1152 [Seinonella peptonophila]|uniref:Transposase n=1 Tax=Seinonella peptonophila TaxID=112248 RepID=A0A1M5ANP8_9BACL|nr:hypothetical protein SAMN05444392_1152 [Seinonella peptonophila]